MGAIDLALVCTVLSCIIAFVSCVVAAATFSDKIKRRSNDDMIKESEWKGSVKQTLETVSAQLCDIVKRLDKYQSEQRAVLSEISDIRERVAMLEAEMHDIRENLK